MERRLATGGFADVFRAYDTIEGVQVVLKVPHDKLVDADALDTFKREARLTARLDHPNILPLKNADVIDGHFVIVYPLGLCDLAERAKKRMALKTALGFGAQILDALAYAHERHIAHCDVKPENVIVFDGNRLRLTDFGIAKVAFRTLRAEGTGTVGFVAPEQAMGRPSLRSDVFSAGLILYRLLSGTLPEWPFEWPFPGHVRLESRVHPDMLSVLRRATNLDPRKRFADAGELRDAFERARRKTESGEGLPRGETGRGAGASKTTRFRRFRREYGKALKATDACTSCSGPLAEAMRFCPWCGTDAAPKRGGTRFPASCSRCHRGVKLDWRFCPWCYGGLIGPLSERSYSDARYAARCSKARCRGQLMPFMRYCPWCNAKVTRRWTIVGSRGRCSGCRGPVLADLWSDCPWCGKGLPETRGRP